MILSDKLDDKKSAVLRALQNSYCLTWYNEKYVRGINYPHGIRTTADNTEISKHGRNSIRVYV